MSHLQEPPKDQQLFQNHHTVPWEVILHVPPLRDLAVTLRCHTPPNPCGF